MKNGPTNKKIKAGGDLHYRVGGLKVHLPSRAFKITLRFFASSCSLVPVIVTTKLRDGRVFLLVVLSSDRAKQFVSVLNNAWTMKKNYLVTSSKGKKVVITQLG